MLEKNKLNLILILLVFCIPVFAAAVISMNSEAMGSITSAEGTNKGQIISPVRRLDASLTNQLANKWLLIYPIGQSCDDSCQDSLYAMQQVRFALGRKMDRVEILALAMDDLSIRSFAQLKQSDEGGKQADKHVLKEEVFKFLINSNSDGAKPFYYDASQAIYIADPLGNVMLRYEILDVGNKGILKARDVLKDLTKMLKLSKVG